METAGTARRAKLNYLRNRKGKSAMAVREKAHDDGLRPDAAPPPDRR